MTLLGRARPTSTCHHCASSNVHWFTPASASTQGVVLLCRRCRQLTIIPGRRQARSQPRRLGVD